MYMFVSEWAILLMARALLTYEMLQTCSLSLKMASLNYSESLVPKKEAT